MCSTQLASAPAFGDRADRSLAADPASLTADGCIELAANLEAEISVLQAKQQEVLAVINDRHNDPFVARGQGISRHMHQILAAELAISPGMAESRLVRGAHLATFCPDVLAGLATGKVPSLRHALAFADALPSTVDPEIAALVEARVLPRIEGLTPGQITTMVKRAVAQLDRAGEEERCKEARARRDLRLFTNANGTAELNLHLPAETAIWMHDLLITTARRLKHELGLEDPTETIAADIMVELVAAFASGTIKLDTDEDGGGATGSESRQAPTTTMTDLHQQINDRILAAAERLSGTAAVTVDLPTAVGAADNPGELRGYGPVPASIARAIAAGAKAWKAWLTNIAGSDVIGLGRTSYAPSPLLRAYLIARDGKCRFPGCPRLAWKSEEDHVISWENGGNTDPANLHTLCRSHHRLKTSGHWTAVLTATATTIWTSPHGKTYRTQPQPDIPPPPFTANSDPPAF